MNLLFKCQVIVWTGGIRFEQFEIVRETPKQYKVKQLDRWRGRVQTINKSDPEYFTSATDALKHALEKARKENERADEQIRRVSSGINKIESVLNTDIPDGHWFDGNEWTTRTPEDFVLSNADDILI